MSWIFGIGVACFITYSVWKLMRDIKKCDDGMFYNYENQRTLTRFKKIDP